MLGEPSRAPSALSQAVSEIVSAARRDKGLTVEKIGKFAGVSKAQASKLLTGKKSWTVRELELVADGLGVRPSTIVREAESRLAVAESRLAVEDAYQVAVRAEAEDWDTAASVKDPDPYHNLGEETQDLDSSMC